MAKKVLYREWRPRNFDEVVGQNHVVQALRQSAISGEIAHAYLFSGTRGTGKTSLAKIFARAINCLHPDENGNPCNSCEVCRGILDGSLLDVIEMDAASNNSVDNIRKITDEVLFMPTLAKYKVYIIDEVHMLSIAAFNALLKTLEEPPQHVVFILATTDPQRIPATILSRCQRYDFKRIPAEEMHNRLRLIADKNAIVIDDAAIQLIITRSEGALRDAISILDQSRSVYDGPIGREEILEMTGAVNDEVLERLALAIYHSDVDALLVEIDHMMTEGADILRFLSSLACFYRDMLVCKTSRQADKFLLLSKQSLDRLMDLAGSYSQAGIIRIINQINRMQLDVKQSLNPRISLELGLIQLLDESKLSREIERPLAVDRLVQQSSAEQPKQPAQLSQSGQSKQSLRSTQQPQAPVSVASAPEKATPATNSGPAARPTAAEQPVAPSLRTEETSPPDDYPMPEEVLFPDEPPMPEAPPEEDWYSEPVKQAEPIGAAYPAAPAASIGTATGDKRIHPTKPASPSLTSPSSDPIFSKKDDIFSMDEDLDFQLSPTSRGASSVGSSGLSSAPKYTSDSDQTADNDNEEADDPNVPVLSDEEVWNRFMKALSPGDPVLAILMNGYNREFQGKVLLVDIPEGRRSIYDKIRKENKTLQLEQLLKSVTGDRARRLIIRLAGVIPGPEEETASAEPEWIQKTRRAANQLGIPIDREE